MTEPPTPLYGSTRLQKLTKYGSPITMIIVGGIFLVLSVPSMLFSNLIAGIGVCAAGLAVFGLGVKWLRDRQRDVPDMAYGSEPYGAVDPVEWAVLDAAKRRRDAKRPRSEDRGRS